MITHTKDWEEGINWRLFTIETISFCSEVGLYSGCTDIGRPHAEIAL